MALSVAQFGQVSEWFSSGASKTIGSLAWSSGDIIIVVGGTEEGGTTIGTPTNSNLTFSLQASVTDGGSSEALAYVWKATAGSSQTGQTITIPRSAGVNYYGAAVWIITGGPSGTANPTANRNESAISLTVSAGSVVCYYFADWTANQTNQTPATGSGTATERVDNGNGVNYGNYVVEWVGTAAGTFSFGPTSYTGMRVGQVVIEVTAPAGGGVTATPSTASLTTTKFAPSVVIGYRFTPTTKALTLSTFVPSVILGTRATPSTASLTISTFTPTVLAPRLVTPTTVSLTTTKFAPQVNLAVTPTTKALSVSTFAPSVILGMRATPSTLALTISTFAPTVTATTNTFARPSTLALTMAFFAPTVSLGGNQRVTPSPASLTLTTFAPKGGATGVTVYPAKIFDIKGNLYKRVTTTKYMKL